MTKAKEKAIEEAELFLLNNRVFDTGFGRGRNRTVLIKYDDAKKALDIAISKTREEVIDEVFEKIGKHLYIPCFIIQELKKHLKGDKVFRN